MLRGNVPATGADRGLSPLRGSGAKMHIAWAKPAIRKFFPQIGGFDLDRLEPSDPEYQRLQWPADHRLRRPTHWRIYRGHVLLTLFGGSLQAERVRNLRKDVDPACRKVRRQAPRIFHAERRYKQRGTGAVYVPIVGSVRSISHKGRSGSRLSGGHALLRGDQMLPEF
jgi:hypothetical protein